MRTAVVHSSTAVVAPLGEGHCIATLQSWSKFFNAGHHALLVIVENSRSDNSKKMRVDAVRESTIIRTNITNSCLPGTRYQARMYV